MEGALLNRIASLSTARLVKQNMYREVYFLRPDETKEGIYVKKYNARDLTARFLSRVFPTQAQREWQMMLEMREKGLPVPLPLALGRKEEGGKLTEYLVTQEIPEGRPIRECTHWDKETLLKALATLTIRLHKSNVFLKDFQLGNVLLKAPTARQAPPLLYLLDLHSARSTTTLTKRQKIRMLAKLLSSFEPPAVSGPSTITFNPADWERFLELYARGIPDFRNEFNANTEKVKSLANKIRCAHLRSRTQRCLEESTSFAVENHDGWRVYRRRDFPTEKVFKLLRDFENPAASPATGYPQTSAGIKCTSKTHLKILESEGERICVKHYWCDGMLDYLKGLVGLSRARRAWIIGNGLVARGILTAQPFALVECTEEAFLLSRALTEFSRLDYYILENFRGAPDLATSQKRKELVVAVAKMVRLLHEKRIYHGDLKACNILVEERQNNPAEGMTWQFYLIDYDRVIFDREISLRRRAKNLAQLHTSIPWCISRSDRMRFYREYSRGLGLDKKDFLRTVLQFSARRIPVFMEPIE
jgi:tRNA A-37 threonylcarbamoyl transferase component Bud32